MKFESKSYYRHPYQKDVDIYVVNVISQTVNTASLQVVWINRYYNCQILKDEIAITEKEYDRWFKL